MPLHELSYIYITKFTYTCELILQPQTEMSFSEFDLTMANLFVENLKQTAWND